MVKNKNETKRNYNVMLIVTFLVGVLLIFATYAWFYSALNVQIKFFNLVVSNDSGLSISFDGITFDSTVEISKDMLINRLKDTYPTNTSQWASLGLNPVSSNGIKSTNDSKFSMYDATNYGFKDKARQKRYLSTKLIPENKINDMNHFISFDLFLKNVTGSPISDNIYLDSGTQITIDNNQTEEMISLLNSMRIGFIKIGTVPLDSNVNDIQNMNCNNNCEMVIYEPNNVMHNDLSKKRALNYGIELVDGRSYPTYAVVDEVNEIFVSDSIKGNLKEGFSLQLTRFDFAKYLFELPEGITKLRVYVWIEGQDIDSLESYSGGADISININLTKDNAGYDYYNE